MAAPVMVETFTIPKADKVEPGAHKKNNNNNHNERTGFPFDESDFGERDRNRDRSFRSHIDDIVQRHPELAEHLNFDRNFDRFPFRNNTWGSKRRGSASSEESRPSSSAAEHPEPRRFARPFGTRFEERFGFPFSRTFDGEPEYSHQQKAQPRPPQQERPQPEEKPQPQAQPPAQQPPQQEEKATEKPPQVPSNDRGRKQNPNLPQSSTVDLGQKQDPVHDTRGQRSMSAPPENRAGQQRFVSSINIPMQSGGDAGAPQTQPQPQQPQAPQPQQWQQQQNQQGKSHERVIPIHVEGRDEPVMPKHGNQPFTQPPPQPERVFAQPQPERTFGQRPAGFGHWNRSESPYYTGEHIFPADSQFFPGEGQYFEDPQFFMNRGEPHPPRTEEYFPGPFRQQQQQQQQQPPKPQPKQPPPQHPQPQHAAAASPPPPPQPQQQQQQQQETAPPQPPPPKTGPIDQIHVIQKDVLALMTQVEQFNGKPRDKQYAFLDEMLTRNLLKLDDVETEGKDNIRLARKEAINCIQRCISILEAKAAANELLRGELMEIEKPSAAEPIPFAALEVGGVSRSGTESAVSEQPPGSDQQVENVEGPAPMEVAPAAPTENAEAAVLVQAEVKSEEQPIEAAVEAKEEEQAEANAAGAAPAEQPAGDAPDTSQPMEAAVQEEVKDKKEKKKDKSAEKAEKK